MRPVWDGEKLTVELHQRDRELMNKATAFGKAFASMGQKTGQPLVDACEAILKQDVEKQDKDNG